MSRIRLLRFMKSAIRMNHRQHYSILSNHETDANRSSWEVDQDSGGLLTEGNLTKVLKGGVIYENEKIVCLNKPAGVLGYTTKFHSSDEFTNQCDESLTLEDVLHQLARDLDCESLRICHVPHPLYSGATILAKTDAAASILQSVFRLAKRREEYIRTDLALTVGIPSPRKGLIKIPVEKKEINGKIQALPIFNAGKMKMRQKSVKSRRTRYNVLDRSHGMGLVELQPRDGLGHLSLLHIACKMCQVLGDKEFSNRIVKVSGVRMLLDVDKVETGTQKLAPRIKNLLDLKTLEDVRNLPLYVHRWKLSLPSNLDLDLPEHTVITAPLPSYFSETLERLGMQDPES